MFIKLLGLTHIQLLINLLKRKMKVENIDINKIDSYKNHPFKVNDDISFQELKQSINNNGLLTPKK